VTDEILRVWGVVNLQHVANDVARKMAGD